MIKRKVVVLYKRSPMNDWIFNNPQARDAAKLKSFKAWIGRNRDTLIEMYHGTSADLPISDEGLKRTSRKTRRFLTSSPGYVYLSATPSLALEFGRMAYPDADVEVYAVRVPLKDMKAINMLQIKSFGGGHEHLGRSLAESIITSLTVRVKRDIQPYELRKLSKLKRGAGLFY